MNGGEKSDEKYSRTIDPDAWKEVAALVKAQEKQRKQEEAKKKREARRGKMHNWLFTALSTLFILVALAFVAAIVFKGLRNILDFCSGLVVIAFGYYIISFLCSVVKRVFRKEPIAWDEYNPKAWFAGKDKQHIVLYVILFVGVVNLITGSVFRSNVIGAFYERADYDETYEATLFIDDKPIFCLAEMSRYEGEYNIWEVHLPYGRSSYTDCEYDPDDIPERIDINGWDCYIELVRPATDKSHALLENTFTSNYGDFCASKESDVYHFTDCHIAKNISSKNLVFFQSKYEAEVFGFYMCDSCSCRY